MWIDTVAACGSPPMSSGAGGATICCMESQTELERSRTGPEPHDESQGLEFGAVDIIFATLTLPLLFWALMYAVTGQEQLYATRRGRMRIYLVLLAIEAIIVLGIVWWVVWR